MTKEYEVVSKKVELFLKDNIMSKIYKFRGVHVMMDSDLAELYHVETKYLNRAVRRNIERFPEHYMFQLNKEEYGDLRYQIGTSKDIDLKIQNGIPGHGKGGRRYLPYMFTEQGVAMLSAVLHTEVAVKVSIQIIDAFIAMRRFITSNAQIFQRLDTIEVKQSETDRKLIRVLNALETKELTQKQGLFFDGQIFDAYRFVSELFRSANRSIIIIDNYIDDTVLTHLIKRKKNVKVILLVKRISQTLLQDVEKFNEQYPIIKVKNFNISHDRFIIIDNSEVYHFGASLKDLGEKWFAFSKMDIGALDLLSRLDKII